MDIKKIKANELQAVNGKIQKLIIKRKQTNYNDDITLNNINNKLDKLYNFKYSLLKQINN